MGARLRGDSAPGFPWTIAGTSILDSLLGFLFRRGGDSWDSINALRRIKGGGVTITWQQLTEQSSSAV